MEQRDGLIEFRTVVIEVLVKKEHDKQTAREKEVLEYRQCFKGIWTPWKAVK